MFIYIYCESQLKIQIISKCKNYMFKNTYIVNHILKI